MGVNNRNIRVAKNNLKVSNLQVKLQVVTTVSAVLNLYWDLVSFNEAVRIKEQALETAQKLFDGNKKQVEIGALPAIEVTRAAAEVSASKEDLLIAQTNLSQQEIVLKNALNRNSMQKRVAGRRTHHSAGPHRGTEDRGDPAGHGPDSGSHGKPAGDRAEQDQPGQLARSC